MGRFRSFDEGSALRVEAVDPLSLPRSPHRALGHRAGQHYRALLIRWVGPELNEFLLRGPGNRGAAEKDLPYQFQGLFKQDPGSRMLSTGS